MHLWSNPPTLWRRSRGRDSRLALGCTSQFQAGEGGDGHQPDGRWDQERSSKRRRRAAAAFAACSRPSRHRAGLSPNGAMAQHLVLMGGSPSPHRACPRANGAASPGTPPAPRPRNPKRRKPVGRRRARVETSPISMVAVQILFFLVGMIMAQVLW